MANTSLIKKAISNDDNLFALAQNGDIEAQNMLVEKHIKLCHMVALRYSKTYDHDDAVSLCVIALVKAIQTFDTKKGYKFSSYAVRCMNNEMLMDIRKEKKHRQIVSFEEPIINRYNDSKINVADTLAEDDNLDENMIQSERVRAVKIALKELKNFVSERDYTIFLMYHGFGGYAPHSERSVAEKVGLSRSYISKIVRACNDYIITKLKEYNLDASNLL